MNQGGGAGQRVYMCVRGGGGNIAKLWKLTHIENINDIFGGLQALSGKSGGGGHDPSPLPMK